MFAVIHLDKKVRLLYNWINQSWFWTFYLEWHSKTTLQLQSEEFYDWVSNDFIQVVDIKHKKYIWAGLLNVTFAYYFELDIHVLFSFQT